MYDFGCQTASYCPMDSEGFFFALGTEEFIMNVIQKQRVEFMRSKNKSYATIAAAIGISENTIKSYCRRNS